MKNIKEKETQRELLVKDSNNSRYKLIGKLKQQKMLRRNSQSSSLATLMSGGGAACQSISILSSFHLETPQDKSSLLSSFNIMGKDSFKKLMKDGFYYQQGSKMNKVKQRRNSGVDLKQLLVSKEPNKLLSEL